jgi:5'-deoxynucleotidase YfbR-like HD superfamily hydrolase
MTRFDFDIDELAPAEAHDAWTEMTSLTAEELRAVKESTRNEVYLEQAEGNQGDDDPPIPGGPLDDAIHLAETPRDEWGADERAEAAEAENFLNRTLAQFDQSEGETLVDEAPKIHKDEMSIIRWGFDPAPEDEYP